MAHPGILGNATIGPIYQGGGRKRKRRVPMAPSDTENGKEFVDS